MQRWQVGRNAAALALISALVSACARTSVPENHNPVLFDREKTASTSHTGRRELTFNTNVCPPPGEPEFLMPASVGSLPAHKRKRRRLPLMRYSSGDRFNILILNQPEFSGDYAVNADGTVSLPFAGQIQALGLTNEQLRSRIERSFVRKGVFTAEQSRVSVRPMQYAPVNVTVAGAVFNPGRHVINILKADDKQDKVIAKFGDSPIDRFIASALQVAGGVRPDADLSKITVVRDGRAVKMNWRGALTGEPVDDMPLIEGDHIEVGEAGCFQSGLVRQSQITPTSVKVFSSNLTVPALSNASSTQQESSAGGVPYGTRLLQGLVQANCVGGTLSTNARRYAVLISRNPKTRKTEVVQRSIEELVRSADRDTINPFLMPGDAIACYDSGVTEFRDVMSVIYGAVLPVKELRTF